VLSRRTLLAAGAGLVVAACGSSKDGSGASGSGSTGSDPSGTSALAGLVVLQRFTNTALTPGRVRLPISFGHPDGSLATSGPPRVTGTVVDADGATMSSFDAALHGVDMLLPYWPVTATIDAPGIYGLSFDGIGGEPTPFQVFDPKDVKVPTVGSPMPGFDTPTVDDARGVDPICTRSPACPFHEVTLTEALTAGKPVVYLIGTPAHCEIGSCAPGLEYLIEQSSRFAGKATFLHAEVYADPAATQVAPAVDAVKLDFEPVIFVTDGRGTLVERIDVIWDGEDLAGLLDVALS
jgi:hypothetical protein